MLTQETMTKEEIVKAIANHYEEIEKTLTNLSHMKEGEIVKFPDYIYAKKQFIIIRVGVTDNYFIKAYVDNKLKDKYVFYIKQVDTGEELAEYTSPYEFDINNLGAIPFGNLQMQIEIRMGHPSNEVPVSSFFLMNFHKEAELPKLFSTENAKKKALDIWNNINNKLDIGYSFVFNLKKILDKFSAILNLESYGERKVHRFINEHKSFLLPQFVNCYFEHSLFLEGEKRNADFILEREVGFPALLIELESPVNDAFKNNGEPKAMTHHAGEQIKEWIKFISENSDNCKGNMKFLAGKKERLVIIGRGVENHEQMENTNYSELTIWTYDQMILDLKRKWNSFIKEQCKACGIDTPNLLEL